MTSSNHGAAKHRRLVAVLGVAAAIWAPVVLAAFPAWSEGNTYPVGTMVTYNGLTYQATVAHTA